MFLAILAISNIVIGSFGLFVNGRQFGRGFPLSIFVALDAVLIVVGIIMLANR